MRLEGAKCLVVGGARRAGRVVALDLAAHGADVAVSTRSATDEAAQTCAAIRGFGRRGLTVSGDAAVPAEAARLVSAAAEALDGLDVLVYAASGPFRPALPQHADPAEWQASFDVIVRGFFAAACAAREVFVDGLAPAPRAAAAASLAPDVDAGPPADAAAPVRGVIVALTDVLGTIPSAAFAGHGAAKAAQIMLVASLAKAWAPDGVRVCGVAPGPIDLTDDPRREATMRAAAKSATGHLVDAAEIARAVRFMIACDALTGVNLPVDGGELLGRSAL
jgi:NAD(P)-dependent dehydrogenase (short-subunit alcohol dehydrogenase family)